LARPGADVDARRADLIAAAEAVLRANRGRRLVMSDVAAQAGMSQSYAYRFFADKDALVAAMAQAWFAEVTAAVRAAAANTEPVEARLLSFVLVQLRLKTARHDSDPELFAAYLDLAAGHMDQVAAHVAEMRAVLEALMVKWRGEGRAAQAARVFDDATRMFRDPYVIARMRSDVTEARARDVVAAVLAGLRSDAA
jgi:AcrR family transcriptional regulator